MGNNKQEDPISFRPYPPIRRKINEYMAGVDDDNRNYLLNVIVGEKFGLNEEQLKDFRRRK